MKLGRRKRAEAEIPTASMADIAFLLIIFFMTATIFSREKGLKIVLPEKGEVVKVKSSNIMEVLVSPEGRVLIEDKEVSINEVREIVKDKLAENDSLVISLKVSREAPYQTMIDVFDELKLAKARKISLAPVLEEEIGGE